jgi:cell division protein FtsB
VRALVAALLLLPAPLLPAAEAPSVDLLQQEIAALRARNAALERDNAALKAQLAGVRPTAVASAAEKDAARQEDKPQNRIRLPSNVTINHNPR